jgi:hypothetical protein
MKRTLCGTRLMVGQQVFQPVNAGSNPVTRSTPELYLEYCSMSHPLYKEIRDQHYVGNVGSMGQQVHFLVHYKGDIVGIISGGSAVYAVNIRDVFFGISKANREKVINGLVDNTVFRLLVHEKNLASRIVALWREAVAVVWEEMYGAAVYGYETFVIERGGTAVVDERRVETTPEQVGQDKDRHGHLYLADNWTLVGISDGSSKTHRGKGRGGLTGGQKEGEEKTPFIREAVPKKLVFCKWRKGFDKPVEFKYISSWRSKTPEEKQLQKDLAKKRRQLNGMCYYWN